MKEAFYAPQAASYNKKKEKAKLPKDKCISLH